MKAKEVRLMSLIKYLVQYRFSHMGDLIRNSSYSPLKSDKSLKGKTIVISGATSGIGLETARLFAGQGARLICINRDAIKSERLENELKEVFGCEVQTILADFSSFARGLVIYIRN